MNLLSLIGVAQDQKADRGLYLYRKKSLKKKKKTSLTPSLPEELKKWIKAAIESKFLTINAVGAPTNQNGPSTKQSAGTPGHHQPVKSYHHILADYVALKTLTYYH